MRTSVDGLQQALGGILINSLAIVGFRFENQFQIGVGHGILVGYIGRKEVQIYTDIMLVSSRNGYQSRCFACNGIAQVTAIYLAQTEVVTLEALHQEAIKYLIGIATT